MSRKQLPEINAGSMADIAFLLLIFFLVTTTMNVDMGIFRKIPEKNQKASEIVIKDKNFLEININRNNELMIDNQLINISELKEIALNFIDNGGGFDKNGQPCSWCKGEKNPKLSDHPTKAFIAVKADRNTEYETYVLVLDRVNSAYATVRNRLSLKLYRKSFTQLQAEYKSAKKNKEKLLQQIKTIQQKYPLLLSEIDEKQDMAKR